MIDVKKLYNSIIVKKTKKNMKNKLLIKFTFVSVFIIGILILIMVFTDNEILDNFSLNLMTEIIGFIFTVAIFERILKKYTEINEIKKSKIVAVQFNKVIQRYLDLFSNIYKASIDNVPDDINRDLETFFNEEFYNTINNFDWHADGPQIIEHDVSQYGEHKFRYIKWINHIIETLNDIEEQSNSYFEKYTYWMTDEMLKNYSDLIDVKLSKNITYQNNFQIKNERITNQDYRYYRLRFTTIAGNAINKIVKIAILSNEYNNEHFDDIEKLVAKGTLLLNNVAPFVNSATISHNQLQLYEPNNTEFYHKFIKS